jgi:asparagine synthase (glutamine-hydrolysing)
MCGIAGVLNLKGERADPGLLHRMIGMVRYRGPDDCGVYTDGPLGLAHARLSIIDVSGGHQPMHNEEKALWITFNGEIFNYIELRQELIEKGYRFSTRSDTEVILRLYEEKGEDCVKYFNGQWAFAIWDQKRQKLFLSRDRLGVRPLFYAVSGKSFLFGSEIKTVLAHPDAGREIDLHALDQIFTFWSAVSPRTIFRGITELSPGHSLVVEQGKVQVKPYWRPEYKPAAAELSVEDYAGRLRELLIDATTLRLRSDVPVGAYLSGGLDSTVITSLIKKFTNTPLKTFSVVFDDPEFDESLYQKEVIKFLGADHEEVRCTGRDIARVFPQVIWHAETPVLRTAPAPLFLLSERVHDRGYKVVLTGEGADEILGGYDIFKEAKIRRFWGAFPDSRIRPLLLKKLYPYLQNIQSQPEAYLKAFFHVRPEDRENPFFSHLPRWELTSKLKLFFSPEVKSALKDADPYAELRRTLPESYSRWDSFSQAQYLETASLLPGYILSSQGDRMAMAHSVEGRFPFLDHRVVEFAAAVPPRLKMKGLKEKYILKQAVGDLIPPSVKKRTKQPYRAPEARSFFDGPEGGGSASSGYIETLLSRERLSKDGIFHPGAVQKLVAKAKSNQPLGIKDNMALVGIISTGLLVEQFINHFNRWDEHGGN